MTDSDEYRPSWFLNAVEFATRPFSDRVNDERERKGLARIYKGAHGDDEVIDVNAPSEPVT